MADFAKAPGASKGASTLLVLIVPITGRKNGDRLRAIRLRWLSHSLGKRSIHHNSPEFVLKPLFIAHTVTAVRTCRVRMTRTAGRRTEFPGQAH
jgi:hypothetical protein